MDKKLLVLLISETWGSSKGSDRFPGVKDLVSILLEKRLARQRAKLNNKLFPPEPKWPRFLPGMIEQYQMKL